MSLTAYPTHSTVLASFWALVCCSVQLIRRAPHQWVQVFFMDTLKFFLSLYGHKLPVLSMDISSDSTLLISGSADKNIKIWGLDFGDCHRSIFAHSDSIMQVRQ